LELFRNRSFKTTTAKNPYFVRRQPENKKTCLTTNRVIEQLYYYIAGLTFGQGKIIAAENGDKGK
jgi:hypothetical protein